MNAVVEGQKHFAPRYFFEIPVYRCDLEKYQVDLEVEKQRFMTSYMASPEEAGRWFIESRWYPWDYNETIGWIQLFTFGHRSNKQVRAEYFFVKSKRVVRRPAPKLFKWQGTAFALSIDPKENSSVIFRKIMAALERLHQERPFQGHYIDLDCFRALGEFVRWRQFMNT